MSIKTIDGESATMLSVSEESESVQVERKRLGRASSGIIYDRHGGKAEFRPHGTLQGNACQHHAPLFFVQELEHRQPSGNCVWSDPRRQ